MRELIGYTRGTILSRVFFKLSHAPTQIAEMSLFVNTILTLAHPKRESGDGIALTIGD